MTLRLRGTFMANPRVAPLLSGAIQPRGIEIDWHSGSAGELHTMHLRDSAHDVFEFSLSNFLVTRDRPTDLWDWVMIPVFTSKAVLGLNTLVNVSAGINSAADLRGKRFGIPDYTMTAGLWFRAQLDMLWGVKTQDIEWYVGRTGEDSHGRQMGLDQHPPPGVVIRWSDAASVNHMLQCGELHAAFPAADLPIDTGSGNVDRLFPDRGRQFMSEFHRKAGFLPVNHVVLVQRRLVESHPWVPEALFDAFTAAKEEAFRQDRRATGVFRDENADMDWQAEEFGPDPFPYGYARNRAMLELAAAQSRSDGLTRRQCNVTDLIAESLRDT